MLACRRVRTRLRVWDGRVCEVMAGPQLFRCGKDSLQSCTTYAKYAAQSSVYQTYQTCSPLYTRHTARCVPDIMQGAYQTFCKVCTIHTARCIPYILQGAYQTYCMVYTRHTARCIPDILHGVYQTFWKGLGWRLDGLTPLRFGVGQTERAAA